jgi:hypothetical protein
VFGSAVSTVVEGIVSNRYVLDCSRFKPEVGFPAEEDGRHHGRKRVVLDDGLEGRFEYNVSGPVISNDRIAQGEGCIPGFVLEEITLLKF